VRESGEKIKMKIPKNKETEADKGPGENMG